LVPQCEVLKHPGALGSDTTEEACEDQEVVLLFEARDLSRAKAFAESPDLRDTMAKVGVVDRPDIYFLNG
jgi:hypothetical protein